MNDARDRLIQLIHHCTSCEQCRDEDIADHLIVNGVIAPSIKIGQRVYFVLNDFDSCIISENKITEVGTRGFWTSDFYEPADDIGTFYAWSDIGNEVFLSFQSAENRLEEINNARQTD